MRHFTREQLDRAFNPKTIVVVGAKRSNNYIWIRRFAQFNGKVCAVHVNPDSIRDIEALGVPCYRSIAEVPGPVDYVAVTAPRRAAVEIFEQAIKAKAGAVSYFTSGFAEVEDDEGHALQEKLAALSLESGVALIGPNCLGVYNPVLGVHSAVNLPHGESGPVAMVSQSGTNHSFFVKNLFAWHGIRTARGISLGNAAVLDAADWIEYLGETADAKVLAVYVEGIGRKEAGDYERFIAAVRRVAAKKPVLIWKGGSTQDGSRVIGVHTGSAPVSPDDWRWVLEASGAIGVDSLEELVDTTAMLVKLPPLKGPRAGSIILTGGQGIAVVDTLGRHGLRVPELSKKSLDELATFFDPIGGSYHNPLDAAYATETPAQLARELRILDEDPQLDFVTMDLYHLIMSPQRIQGAFGLDGTLGGATDAKAKETFLDVLAAHGKNAKKPFFMTVTAADAEREGLELRELLKARGVLAIASVERAAKAYATALKVWSHRRT